MEKIKNFNLPYWKEEQLIDFLGAYPEIINYTDDQLKRLEQESLNEAQSFYNWVLECENRADNIRLYREKRKEYREKNGI